MRREIEERLQSCSSLTEFLTMFFGLGIKEKQSIFSNTVMIPEGTDFYRIRKTGGPIDENYTDPKEWAPVPKEYAKQGRFNGNGESILYVASSPGGLEREVRLKKNEEYYLAHYVCRQSFSVGCFLRPNSWVNTLLHRVAMSLSSEDDLTDSEKRLLVEYIPDISSRTLEDLGRDILSPLYIHKLIPDFYSITNKLGNIVLSNNEYGIRYASAFAPIELSGAPVVLTLAGVENGNYALTGKGYANLQFVSAEKKKCNGEYVLDVLIKASVETQRLE